MDTPPTIAERQIVVVEPDDDLGHIVALSLAHHGHPVRVFRALADAWEALRDVPAVVILDLGPAALDDWIALAAVERHPLLGAAPMVLLAWECPIADDGAREHGAPLCLSKPFDARALDQAVAAALAPAEGAVVAIPEARVESADERAPAPSVWPVVTAGAGFAAMVGFMIHPIYIVVGLILLIVAVLWWTLEPVEPAESGARA